MELTVVGCSGSVPGPESPASCYLVQAPYEGRIFSLLLDLGAGAFGNVFRFCAPRDLDAVALSHLHPDHCVDMCALYVASRYSPSASALPWPMLAVYGPAGTAGRLAAAYEVPGRDEVGGGIAGHFDYRTWEPVQQIGPFRVTTARVDHPVEAYALRVDEVAFGGGTIVYSGDTGPTPVLAELARDADLLLAESAFLDSVGNPPGLHLTGRQAAEAAAKAGVALLVLTHIPPWHDAQQVLAEARPHFAGSIQLAAVGARWTVGDRR